VSYSRSSEGVTGLLNVGVLQQVTKDEPKKSVGVCGEKLDPFLPTNIIDPSLPTHKVRYLGLAEHNKVVKGGEALTI